MSNHYTYCTPAQPFPRAARAARVYKVYVRTSVSSYCRGRFFSFFFFVRKSVVYTRCIGVGQTCTYTTCFSGYSVYSKRGACRCSGVPDTIWRADKLLESFAV